MSEENPTTPPWEANGEEFSPERAWQLIQNLKGEKQTLQTRLDTATSEKDAEITRLTGELTEKTNSLTEVEGKVTTLETSLGEKDGALAKNEAVIKKQQLLSDAGLPLKYVAQVVGDDDAAWTESVKSLQELAGTSSVQRTPDPVQAAAGGTPPVDKNAEGKAFFGIN